MALLLRPWWPVLRSCRFYPSCNVPVIRFSRRTQLWLEKQKKGPGGGSMAAPPRAGKLLISTRRRELNQASGETGCGGWEQLRLVSQGWKHRKSRGDFFTVKRQREHRAWPETQDTFHALGLDSRVVSSLDALNLTTPTWVQKEAIPTLLSGNNLLCAAETGSGKTLVYLLPIMHKLLNQEKLQPDDPGSLIVVPSRELAGQVTSVARRLGIRARCLGGGQGSAFLKKQPDWFSVDVLVSTPGILVKALKWDKVNLNALGYLVLDEVDTLFDPTFSALVEKILAHTCVASHPREALCAERKAQLVAIGATFPKKAGEILGKITDLGSICTVRSKKLHHLMPHVQQTFKRLKGLDKLAELLELLKKPPTEPDRPGVLVFCNHSSTVNWLGYILDDHGIKQARLHGQMPAAMRLGIFDSFQKGRVDVLLCTDLASRGLDSCRVGTVINYDFPYSLEDYIHRAGRVGRVGSTSQGNVLSFVTHPWDVEVVQKIETAARKRTSLPGMESNMQRSVSASHLIKESGD
ncbi:putative ATP-dependent RNA helicase DDX28 [Gastrophryne carolinensis]